MKWQLWRFRRIQARNSSQPMIHGPWTNLCSILTAQYEIALKNADSRVFNDRWFFLWSSLIDSFICFHFRVVLFILLSTWFISKELCQTENYPFGKWVLEKCFSSVNSLYVYIYRQSLWKGVKQQICWNQWEFGFPHVSNFLMLVLWESLLVINIEKQ